MVNIKRSAPVGPNEDVADLNISPDGRWVVYRAGKVGTNISAEPPTEEHNLFSVPIDGGMVVQLNGLLTQWRSVRSDYAISADSRHVAYRAQQDDCDKTELYSVPIGGPAGTGLKLNGTLPSGGDVGAGAGYQGFRISPDGRRLVYLAN